MVAYGSSGGTAPFILKLGSKWRQVVTSEAVPEFHKTLGGSQNLCGALENGHIRRRLNRVAGIATSHHTNRVIPNHTYVRCRVRIMNLQFWCVMLT